MNLSLTVIDEVKVKGMQNFHFNYTSNSFQNFHLKFFTSTSKNVPKPGQMSVLKYKKSVYSRA